MEKLQVVIEVDAAKGTAVVKGVGDSFADLQKKAGALAGEYGKVAGAANKASAEQQQLSDKTRQASDTMSRMAVSSRSLAEALKSHWVAAGAAVYGAYAMMSKGMEYMQLSAKAKQAEESFHLVAKAAEESGDRIIRAMKKASAGTVDDSDIMQKAVKGMMLGLKEDEMVKIMEAARVSARVAGEDVRTAYERITDAIATDMPRALKQYGLITKEQMDIVNRALAAGVTDVHLYDIAMGNAAIQAAKMGAIQRNTAESLQVFHAQLNETKETIGLGLTLVLKGAYDSFSLLASAIMNATGGLASLNALGLRVRIGINELLGAGDNDKTQAMRDSLAWYVKFADDMAGAAKELREEIFATNGAIMASNRQTAEGAQESLRDRMEELKKETAATKEREERNKVAVDNFTTNLNRQIEALNEFEKEYAKIGRTTSEIARRELDIRLEVYLKHGADIVRVEKLKQTALREIELMGMNESLALQEELFKATGEQKHADAAIAAMKEILDAEEKKWAVILKSDEDAHRLRIKREEDYTRKLKSSIHERVEATKDGYEEQIQAAQDYAAAVVPQPLAAAGGNAAAGGLWNPTGLPVGPGSGGPIYNISMLTPGWGQLSQNMSQVAENTRRTAEESARTAAAAEEEAKRAAEQEMRERQQAYQGVYGRYAGMIQERERRDWGMVDYTAEFARLGESFAASSDYQLSLDLLGEMLDTLTSIDRFEEQALQESRKMSDDLAKQGETISEWLSDLTRSNLAPVQSAEAWGVTFAEKLAAALADPSKKTSEFLSFARDYLDFAKAYADNEDYLAAYQAVTGAVDTLGGYVEVLGSLADLGIGSTATDLANVAAAFNELQKAATDASGWQGLSLLNSQISSYLPSAVRIAVGNSGLGWLANMLVNSLPIAVDKTVGDNGLRSVFKSLYNSIPEATRKAVGEDGLKKLADALGITLPDKTGVAVGGTDLLTGALDNTEAPFNDVSEAVGNTASNVKTQLGIVGGFFDALASAMGLNLNSSSVATAIKNLTPPPITRTEYLGPEFEYLPHTEYAVWVGTNWDKTPIYKTPSGHPAYAEGLMTWYEQVRLRAKGGLTEGLSIAGEIGPEWVVPTYEPERARFLDNAPPDFWGNLVIPGRDGARPSMMDSEAVGRALANQLKPLLAGLAGAVGGEIHLHVHLDGREIASSVENQMRQGHRGLVEQTKRIMKLTQ